MKRLFVCCDGTWNSDSDEFQGVPVPTNVVRFFNALKIGVTEDGEQLAYYHVGIGANENFLARTIDGAFGLGLTRDIRTAYKWLSDHYQDGDEIFVIGFSRGAFTARSLVGMLHHCGLPHGATWPLVKEAWELYRLDPKQQSNLERQTAFRKMHNESPEIRFLGVWDTVGSLGVPEKLDLLRVFSGRYRFHDLTLSPEVRRAVQALAIDEERDNFLPTLWEFNGAPVPDYVSQVWFPGVHADVGGGYRETQLSDITLKWMIDEAQSCGAVFESDMLAQVAAATQDFTACVHGVLHNSLTTFYRQIGYRPRSIPKLAPGRGQDAQEMSHIALARQANPPIAQAPYRPNAFPFAENGVVVRVFARPLWNWTGIYIEAGIPYTFVALPDQSWIDWYKPSDAGGRSGGLFDFLLSWRKRLREANWFELCGAIMSEAEPTIGGVPPDPYLFRIGNRCTFVSPVSGYLYGFANDARGGYWNNRGSVQVQVVAGMVRDRPLPVAATDDSPDKTTPPTAPGGAGVSDPQ
jgi:Uncharacterized alpha/beta hydrolase domain (DUF2235)